MCSCAYTCTDEVGQLVTIANINRTVHPRPIWGHKRTKVAIPRNASQNQTRFAFTGALQTKSQTRTRPRPDQGQTKARPGPGPAPNQTRARPSQASTDHSRGCCMEGVGLWVVGLWVVGWFVAGFGWLGPKKLKNNMVFAIFCQRGGGARPSNILLSNAAVGHFCPQAWWF